MKIEILFPEFCNIYGDYGNIIYLKECLPEAEFIETSLNEEPKFITEDVDLVYMVNDRKSTRKDNKKINTI